MTCFMFIVYSRMIHGSKTRADEEADISEENISDLCIEERHMPENCFFSLFIDMNICHACI